VRRLTAIAFVAAALAWAAAPAHATHVSCEQTVTADTVLDSDLDCLFLPAAITIGAPGISLDLGGYTVRGRIRNPGFDDVRIMNGVIAAPLVVSGAAHNEIRNIVMDANPVSAGGSVTVVDSQDNLLVGLERRLPTGQSLVQLPQSVRNTIADGVRLNVLVDDENRIERLSDSMVEISGDRNQVIGNTGLQRLHLSDGGENVIADNSFSTDHVAIELIRATSTAVLRNQISTVTAATEPAIRGLQSSSSQIADNTISGPGIPRGEDLVQSSGVSLTSGTANVVSGNVISGRIRGVELMSTTGNAVTGNVVSEVNASGLFLYLADRNEISRNSIASAAAHGIEISSFSDENRVEHNTATRNGADGISILAGQGTGNLVARNFVRFNRDDGIGVESPGNILARNHAVHNFDWGIEAVEGTIDGEGNRAAGNGQRAQCLNVTCRRR
jgi:parallel beta-helix repeat protein